MRQTLLALWKAWWQIRLLRLRTDAGALLPAVAAPEESGGDIRPDAVWRQVERIVRPIIFWKRNTRCFYRSFCVASVLRQHGIDARLGFGLKVSMRKRRLCHCWVTVEGQAICEGSDPLQTYPIPLGAWNGLVSYWLADGDRNVSGDKRDE